MKKFFTIIFILSFIFALGFGFLRLFAREKQDYEFFTDEIAGSEIFTYHNAIIKLSENFLRSNIPVLSEIKFEDIRGEDPETLLEKNKFTFKNPENVSTNEKIGFVLELAVGNEEYLSDVLDTFKKYSNNKLKIGAELSKVWFLAYKEHDIVKSYGEGDKNTRTYSSFDYPDVYVFQNDKIFGKTLTLTFKNDKEEAVVRNFSRGSFRIGNESYFTQSNISEVLEKANGYYFDEHFRNNTYLFSFINDNFNSLESLDHIVFFMEGDIQLSPEVKENVEIINLAKKYNIEDVNFDFQNSAIYSNEFLTIIKKAHQIEFSKQKNSLCTQNKIQINICLIKKYSGNYRNTLQSLLESTVFKSCDLTIEQASNCF